MTTPSYEKLTAQVETGAALAQDSADLREALRWKAKTDDEGRAGDLVDMLERIRLAMIPIRSEIGRLVWEPLPAKLEEGLRTVSARLQYERKQLKKMQR